MDRICRAVFFWRGRSDGAPNRALIHLGTKLTWMLPRFSWEGVVAGIDDADPRSATAATIHRVGALAYYWKNGRAESLGAVLNK